MNHKKYKYHSQKTHKHKNTKLENIKSRKPNPASKKLKQDQAVNLYYSFITGKDLFPSRGFADRKIILFCNFASFFLKIPEYDFLFRE